MTWNIFYFSFSLCDNSSLLGCGVSALMGALSENQCLTHLSLLHTGLRDLGAVELAQELEQQQQWPLQELNVAFNDLTGTGALALLKACRNLPTFHTVQWELVTLPDGWALINNQGRSWSPANHLFFSSLYMNQIWEVDLSADLNSRNIRVLFSLLEGSEVSENWTLVLSRIQENTSSGNQDRVKQQLKVQLLLLLDLQWGLLPTYCTLYTSWYLLNQFVCEQVFLKDLQVGRQQQQHSWLKRLHFFWVETSVHQVLKKLQKES